MFDVKEEQLGRAFCRLVSFVAEIPEPQLGEAPPRVILGGIFSYAKPHLPDVAVRDLKRTKPLQAIETSQATTLGQRACTSSTQNSVHQR